MAKAAIGLGVIGVNATNMGSTVSLLKDVSDLRYEFQLALANRAVGGVAPVFIMTGDPYALTRSSLIRQVVSLGGDVRQLAAVLPANVVQRLLEKRGQIPPEPLSPDDT